MYHKDYETYSACDIGFGATRYARDPSTEILMLALARDNEEPLLWLPHQWRSVFPGHDWTPAEALLKEYVESSEPVYAHNSGFEIAVSQALFRQTFGYPAPDLSRYRCTAAMARRAALPHSLKKCAEALNLPQQKDNRGSALIRKFSCPQKDGSRILPTDEPEAFREFCQYCLQDVVVEQAIHRALHLFELKGFPLATYQLDIMINQRGIPVNIPAARHAQSLIEQATDKLTKEFFELTGLQPTQGKKFLAWLKERNYSGSNLQKKTIEDVLEEMESDEDLVIEGEDEVSRALKMKQSIGFASLAKIPFMICSHLEGRVYDALMYYGALRTGRWAGAGLQIQNFKKPIIKNTKECYKDICGNACLEWIESEYGPGLPALASCIRHFIHNPGHNFGNADFAAIEARIILWLSDQQDVLDMYRNGQDLYLHMASVIYDRPVAELQAEREKNDGNLRERDVGKEAVLGCGFQLGPQGFLDACAKKGITIPLELAEKAVAAFRETRPKLVNFWKEMERGAKKALTYPGQKVPVGKYVQFVSLRTAGKNFLFMRLPSGRHLAYPDAKLVPTLLFREKGKLKSLLNPTEAEIAAAKTKDERAWVSDSITYWGPAPKKKATWVTNTTYSGKLAENCTQAVAADIMAYGAMNAEKHGYHTITLVHDEIITELLPGQNIKELIEHLTVLPPWAEGLPLKAEGKVIPFYSK